MKNYFILLLLVGLLFSCKEELPDIEEQLANSPMGWRIQQYSVYNGYLDDELNSNVWRHYKNVGVLEFQEDYTGTYSFDTLNVPFTWTISHESGSTGVIYFAIDNTNLSDYSSPFLYYYFSGREGDPLYNYEEDQIRTYGIKAVNSFTIVCQYDPNSSGNFYNFGAIEFVLTQE